MNEKSQSQSSARLHSWVLILEPNEELGAEIIRALQEASPGAHVETARTLEEAQHLVLDARPDLFVLDVDATYDLGQEFLYDLRTSHPKARAIVLTGIHLAAHREQAKGLGAIHFLEKPFPYADFVDLAQALLDPASSSDSERFQGTLSDLHIADIVQLKCMSGSTSVLEFTNPNGEKARVYFEEGQVRHATAPGKKGVAAFNELVNWKGGSISEVAGAPKHPRTIDEDWQLLLMEAVRKIDETQGESSSASSATGGASGRKILVIDDSLMLLSFVNEILSEAKYEVTTAPTALEGLEASTKNPPELILLDYILPDLKGDEVSRRLLENPATKDVVVLYMSGLGTDLKPSHLQNSNVIGFLNKPFTSETLLRTVENYMPKSKSETARKDTETAETASGTEEFAPERAMPANEDFGTGTLAEETAGAGGTSWNAEGSAVAVETNQSFAPMEEPTNVGSPWSQNAPAAANWNQTEEEPVNLPPPDGGAFFSGDTNFFSLHWALRTMAREKLTGTLRCFWDKATVQLLAQKGRIVLATTNDPELYCSEAPITLVNVDAEKIAQARAQQMENASPLFITLSREGLILREPAMQLVQHYGQKLFSQLWTARRVRFVFEQSAELPEFSRDLPAEEDVDQWTLNTLRFIQYQELGQAASYDPESIPGYTRDGFERVQNIRLTVAEAQFASQFNGVRSLAQIAKNLRLDLKFARLTLFRFLALEIVECWPPPTDAKTERRGLLQRFGFGG